MKIEVSNTLTVIDPTTEMVKWCKKHLTVVNPEYIKKSRMHLWLGNTPSMYFGGCEDCSHADHKRKQGEKVRCTRWSRWVSPHGKPCEEHSISFSFNLTPEQYLESLEMMKNYQRKHGGNFV